MEDRQRTTKSILDNYSGYVLDVPNADKKILDDLDTGISILDELPKDTTLEELAKLVEEEEKSFNSEIYDLS
jgi:hypothetical protein|tara:strand:- start:222 stop:437 length:216 start_codon:yes stop_codon:yes gene_type:complete